MVQQNLAEHIVHRHQGPPPIMGHPPPRNLFCLQYEHSTIPLVLTVFPDVWQATKAARGSGLPCGG